QQQRPHERPIIARVRRQLAAPSGTSHAATRAMLGATEAIDPHFGRDLGVLLAQRISMHERAAEVPILRRALRMHHLRHSLRLARQSQDAVGPAIKRISLVAIGKWERVCPKQMIVVLPVVSRWRGEPMIEKSETAPGDVWNHAIEHLPSTLVGVE